MKRLGAVVAAILVAVAGAALFVVPTDHYLFLPDRARPVDPLIRVPGEKGGRDRGGVYMVDILVRKASVLERLFPGVQDGATLVPGEQLNPAGVSEQERRRQSLDEMTTSQKIAVAVALQSLGRTVRIRTEVVDIQKGSPAAKTLEIDDVVVRARGKPIRSPADLFEAMEPHSPGRPVTLTIRRGGKTMEVVVGTRPAPDDPDRAIMGILVDVEITPSVDVKIDAGDIGGPSAGLAFALDIVDELGRDVDRGRTVAVTGALALDGEVDTIGGIKQKTIGARDAGADLFLVPDENAEEARRYAEGLRIVPVSTFGEALSILTK